MIKYLANMESWTIKQINEMRAVGYTISYNIIEISRQLMGMVDVPVLAECHRQQLL